MYDKIMNWNEYVEQINKLGKIINESNFKPDIIVAIARGGWIPTRFLSDVLQVKDLGSIGIKYKDSSRTELITYSKPSMLENYKKILLVEDMLESGKSIKWASEYYRDLGYEIKTACMFILEETKFMPDYYLNKIEDKIQFPWENKNI